MDRWNVKPKFRHEFLHHYRFVPSENFIDGEIAALDPNGKTSFQLLQTYGIRKNIPLVYCAFDLLSLDGTDLRSLPLTERCKLLAKLLKKAPDNSNRLVKHRVDGHEDDFVGTLRSVWNKKSLYHYNRATMIFVRQSRAQVVYI